jgi:ubiquinone/menaquinone biosynthesis C-methylase UbiE
MRILDRKDPTSTAGLAADLGAGWGWLGFQLSQLGYSVLALDVNCDQDYGLGLAVDTFGKHENFLPLQADFTALPIRDQSLSLAVFNASLHHSNRPEETLKSIERKLQPGGVLVIMDTPVGKRSVKAAEQGFRCLGEDELVSTLQKLHLSVRVISIRRGWRWTLFQIRSRWKKGLRFSFPLIAAWKAK